MGIGQKNKRGFTIIEVVLVLAIAGLIFMMVFLALPALQRSQRDTQRKNDLSRVQTAITQYASNNRGGLPDFSGDPKENTFVTGYLSVSGDTFIDPAGPNKTNTGDETYRFISAAAGPLSGAFDDVTKQNVIYYTTGAVCSKTTGGSTDSSSNRKVAVRMYLEGGGIACQNN